MDTPPTFAVTLSVYEWSRLLDELAEHRTICNRDQRTNIALFEAIATQLHNRPVRVIHEQHPDPQYRPAQPLVRPVVAAQTPVKPRWWQRFWQ
jgi:hypothetical protein